MASKFVVLCGLGLLCSLPGAAAIDLSQAVVRLDAEPPAAMAMAARVLTEEAGKRTGLAWPVVPLTDSRAPAVSLRLDAGCGLPAEGFRVEAWEDGAGRVIGVNIVGADGRGVLYGVGWLLRNLAYGEGQAVLEAALPVEGSPRYAVRGHQLGYRHRANSYDAWTVAQYEQYIRELAIFGANAIENIPFEDERACPNMKVPREEMNVRISEICADYGLAYWIWTPATFDLRDTEKRATELDKWEAYYAQCKRLDAVFFPGGDPGHNHPRDVMPFLRDVAVRLHKHHPAAQVWISLQGFDKEKCMYFFDWLEEHMPSWLGGVVAGPSSPPIPLTRALLPAQYPIRHYPDITHTIRCQYEVKWWDPAFAFTLGREAVNPQPAYYAFIHNAFAPYTCGFIAYSDGIHDDVNKAIWSMRGWAPGRDVRAMLIEYARFFFPSADAEAVVDGILALEKNWEGPLKENGGVAASLHYWEELDNQAPALSENWRWQMCLLRAHYDAYVRARLIREAALEKRAGSILLDHLAVGDIEAGMAAALVAVDPSGREPVAAGLRARIVALCDALYASIGLQTSMERHQASGYERGCVLDLLDYPLNNRWWLEDQFAAIGKNEDKTVQAKRLRQIALWDRNDPPEVYYDNLGAVGQCPHLVRGEGLGTDPNMERDQNPTMWWWDSGFSRQRLSFQTSLEFPVALRYDGLRPDRAYEFRMTGYGEAKATADGVPLEPSLYGKEIGDLKVFPIPESLTEDGEVAIAFEKLEEGHLNWRNKSRIAEAWLAVRE